MEEVCGSFGVEGIGGGTLLSWVEEIGIRRFKSVCRFFGGRMQVKSVGSDRSTDLDLSAEIRHRLRMQTVSDEDELQQGLLDAIEDTYTRIENWRQTFATLRLPYGDPNGSLWQGGSTTSFTAGSRELPRTRGLGAR